MTARLEITTMVGCPQMCTFCPQDQLKASYHKEGNKYMSLEDFRTILDKLPLHVRIDFSGMAEPWANPDATEMLKATFERGHRVAIYTTLCGMSVEDSVLITQELLPRYGTQVEVIVLHLPDENMNMRGYKEGSEEYRQVLRNFWQAQVVSDVGQRFSVMTMDGTGRVHPDLKDIIAQNTGPWRGHSRAGSLGEEQTKKVGAMVPPRKDFPLVCAMTPYYDQNVVFPNGDVVLCCMDYDRKHIIGNLLTQGYWEIFEGSELARIRTENQKPGFTKCTICRSCERAMPAQLATRQAPI